MEVVKMNTRDFLFRVVIIVTAIIILMGCALISWTVIGWKTATVVRSEAEDIEVEKVVEIPVDKVIEIEKIVEVPAHTEVQGDTLVCEYILGYDDRGKTFGPGTPVNGPAVVKPYADKAHAFAIMPGTTYTTTHNKEVVWLLRGDSDCVLANAGPDFFTSFEVVGK